MAIRSQRNLAQPFMILANNQPNMLPYPSHHTFLLSIDSNSFHPAWDDPSPSPGDSLSPSDQSVHVLA